MDSLDVAEITALYDSVGWSAYTKDPDGLLRGIGNSYMVAIARGDDGQLLGLARILSDGETIVYLQDILVTPAAQGQGIGRALLAALQKNGPQVRQWVLLTDSEPGQRAFYESLGFVEVHEQQPPLRAFVKLR
ncbi:MAG: GNAT family N-acetyltransferase [Cellulomonadaceae bacterium]|nr:GNAT family N-acetyltransferase [Cellulomonadaceae bacterium]